jgi:hypothetical protein
MPHYEGGARFGTMIRGGKAHLTLLKQADNINVSQSYIIEKVAILKQVIKTFGTKFGTFIYGSCWTRTSANPVMSGGL